jgi:hypothetical protein
MPEGYVVIFSPAIYCGVAFCLAVAVPATGYISIENAVVAFPLFRCIITSIHGKRKENLYGY